MWTPKKSYHTPGMDLQVLYKLHPLRLGEQEYTCNAQQKKFIKLCLRGNNKTSKTFKDIEFQSIIMFPIFF